MGAGSSTWTHHLLLLFFFFPVLAVATSSSHTTTINITNRCSYTVWAAACGWTQATPGCSKCPTTPKAAACGRAPVVHSTAPPATSPARRVTAAACWHATGAVILGRGSDHQTIGSIHHINLVRVIGFCEEKSHRLLVYEYMPKGSLDQWIFRRHGNDDDDTPCLDWQTRCKIIAHEAKGLSYLHEECMKRVAHLDVKPQNILLDDNFDAKLSDFGLCKLIDRDKSQVVTRMRGTPGYLAPEWLTSHITEKADVYSFGVVVMEIISGRKNLDTSRSEKSFHLITLLEEKLKSDRLVDLIDMRSSSDSQAHKQEEIQMMKLAMWCLQIDCKRRPKMSEVVKVLESTMSAKTDIYRSQLCRNEFSKLWCSWNCGLVRSTSSLRSVRSKVRD
ncbi:unnamed protein product [Miscanthus lutarioriparius]|uniref:non-specific serine/threonine protein kinase n=1 Tax=Miscanthus lutarioriparius TaxID=422564 RepID=A0A811QCB8_9POAL|nr:unnamed protein product [Miscanthus lutarioriparius]